MAETSPPVHVFLPCRAGSQRVPGKNTRPFGDLPGGLTELKLRLRLGALQWPAGAVRRCWTRWRGNPATARGRASSREITENSRTLQSARGLYSP